MNCKYCNKPVVGRAGKMYCNIKCWSQFYYQQNRDKMKLQSKLYKQNQHPLIPKNCIICNNLFETRSNKKICCSKPCSMIRTLDKIHDWQSVHKEKCSIAFKDYYNKNKEKEALRKKIWYQNKKNTYGKS